jgi:hypothetical protein
MTNKELQDFLKQYPDEMPIKLRVEEMEVVELTTENILHTSETAYVNDEAPEEEWDCEDGKIELGSGTQYLLLNPLIV